MAVQLDRTAAAGSRLQTSVNSTPPVTHFGWVHTPFVGFPQTLWSEVQVAPGRRVRQRTTINASQSSLDVSNVSSWGAGGSPGATEDLSNETGLEPVMVAIASDASATVYTRNNPTGVVVNITNGTPGDFANADILLIGATYFDGAYQERASLHIEEYARYEGTVLTAEHFAALIATTPARPETITLPVGCVIDDVWPLRPAGSAGAAVEGTLVGVVNGRVLDVVGTVVKSARTSPVTRGGTALTITGPSGAAGAASSTSSGPENSVTGPAFTTSVALGSGYPTITGPDAARFTVVPLTATSWRVDFVSAPNFEAPNDTGTNNVYEFTFNASATVSQTHARTVTDVSEGAGPATVLTGSIPAAAGLTGIRGVVLSAAAPGPGVTVIRAFGDEVFDGAGGISIDIAGLGVLQGQYRWATLTQSNGDPAQSPAPLGAHGPLLAS